MSFLQEEGNIDYTAIKNFHYQWDDDNKPICDCPFLIGAVPVIRKSALTKILAVIPADSVSSIEIQVEGETFVILQANNILSDVLNESKSVINRFSDGRVMSIDKYVFKKGKTYPAIFKISQLSTFTFVSDRISDALTSAHLSGLALEECEVKSTWLF
jgi:hypothetical protein